MQIFVAVLVVLFSSLASGMDNSAVPDAPSYSKATNQARIAHRNFWLLTAVNATLFIGDGVTSMNMIGRHSCPFEVGSPELYGRRPETDRVAGFMALQFMGSELFAYQFKKHRIHIWKVRLWTLPLAFEIGSHGQGFIHNLAVC